MASGQYLVSATASVRLQSNVTLVMAADTVLKALPNASDSYQILRIHEVDNVRVVGGVIVGDRYEHKAATGANGHGISIRGSNNVVVDSVTVKDCWGDGFYMARSPRGRHNESILLSGVLALNNRRMGATVISSRNLQIVDSELSGTNGSAPEGGIYFENNSRAYVF